MVENNFYQFSKQLVEIKPSSTKKESKIKIKDETEISTTSNTVIPQYPFEMYAFGEMCGDDSRMMKRRGPRTTIKQSQVNNKIFEFKKKIFKFLVGRFKSNIFFDTKTFQTCQS